MRWTESELSVLIENYPKLGKEKCAALLNKTEGQIRLKASRLGLKARGVSEAWHNKNKEHAGKLKGRKRPEQSDVIKEMHQAGKLIKTEQQKSKLSIALKSHYSSNPHPKGFQGHSHSIEAKESISEKSKAQWELMTPERLLERNRKQIETKTRNGTMAPERAKASWKAAWRVIGGKRKFYRSRWEANYARYLEFLKQKGEISDWQHESKTFWFEGIKRGCVSYLPDFEVTNNSGEVEFHEVKGWMDDRSKTKIKRMAKYHPDVKLILIDAKYYKSIQSKLSKLIPEWE